MQRLDALQRRGQFTQGIKAAEGKGQQVTDMWREGANSQP